MSEILTFETVNMHFSIRQRHAEKKYRPQRAENKQQADRERNKNEIKCRIAILSQHLLAHHIEHKASKRRTET